jgi:protein phosphatase
MERVKSSIVLSGERPGGVTQLVGEELNAARLRNLGILPVDDRGPFDIVGDVHGCIEELRTLLRRLGYRPIGEGYEHPQGRRLVFVGDLVDRGPGCVGVLRIVLAMVDAGSALLVMGNHDNKLLRWLEGHVVKVSNGLATTLAELDALSPGERHELVARLMRLFTRAPGYLILDAGRLVVTHGAIFDSMIGNWDSHIAHICLYGDAIGVNAKGKPIRRDWGALRDVHVAGGAEAPLIVYGHNVVKESRWVNRTLDLDTGCVYGGRLSALRYPELELIQVRAERTYWERH